MAKLNTIEEIIADLEQGKMVIMMDDEDRENEGDLLMAADVITPEAINFMVKYGRGLVCMPITQKRADLLGLSPQSTQNRARFSTNFTVSIEAAEGVTTGISAHDRATTILAATSPNAKAEDIVQPGHIFPIVAQNGGVLTRAGHTEASCDLMRLAGFSPAAVIVEILNDDGTMARRADLEIFAKQHGLKIGTIADLINYRLRKEKTIEKVAENQISIEGNQLKLVVYQNVIDKTLHYALVKGKVIPDESIFVRVHVQNIFTDLFHLKTSDKTWSLPDAIDMLSSEENGVIVILSSEAKNDDIINAVNALDDEKTVTHNTTLRTYGVGAQILVDLGVQKMRLLSSMTKFTGMSGFNLGVTEHITYSDSKCKKSNNKTK